MPIRIFLSFSPDFDDVKPFFVVASLKGTSQFCIICRQSVHTSRHVNSTLEINAKWRTEQRIKIFLITLWYPGKHATAIAIDEQSRQIDYILLCFVQAHHILE